MQETKVINAKYLVADPLLPEKRGHHWYQYHIIINLKGRELGIKEHSFVHRHGLECHFLLRGAI